MSNRSETFGRLLKGAINSIAAYEGKTAPAIEDELGDQIGVAGSTIQRYKAGYLPTEPRVVQILAEAAVRRGYLSRAWLLRFLQAVRYPNPDTLVAQFGDLLGSTGDQRSSALPGGMPAFLFTDIVGSTTRWEHQPQAMERALARHDELLRQAIDAYGGHVVKTVGDAFQAVFTTAPAALEAALAAQRALANESWGPIEPIRVRMGIHVGSVQIRDDDYFGQPLNRVARLCTAGHGGQVLLSNAAQELVRDALPTGAALRDLGEHRLKDLARPERIFQVTTPDLPHDFPPLRSLDRYTHNLPAQPTALIGREAEALAVCDLLRRAGVRLLTLTGPGGAGKTRLALQAAADLLDDFHDGVWFVALAPIRDATLVLAAIAQALGVAEAPGQSLEVSLHAYLRSRQALLVLDNFEQVLDAGPPIAALLAAAPALKVLATSREMLHLYGEHEYEVPPLSLPDLQHLPPIERLTQYEAVRLFIERAQAVRSDFAVTGENAPAIAEICVRLDGLPLAIELAAARSKLFPPKALLARLDKRLALLTGGPRDLPARQQTLRNTIAWSYDLLDPAEQATFARLGVFVGGCTLAAAEAVLADDRAGAQGDLTAYIPASAVLDGLSSLVDKSLLKQIESADSEPRFVMLETIHEFALEQLAASGESGQMQERHLAYYLTLVERANGQREGIALEQWYARFAIEHDNLQVARLWSRTVASGAEAELRLVAALRWFYLTMGYMSKARAWLEAALERRSGVAPAVQALALLGLGGLVSECGDHKRATNLYRESLALYQDIGDNDGIARVQHYIGYAARLQGLYEDAWLYQEAALAYDRMTGDIKGVIWNLIMLGEVFAEQGDGQQARTYFHEALTHSDSLEDKEGHAWAVVCLGRVAHSQGEDEVAAALYQEGLGLFHELKYRYGIAEVLTDMGDLACAQANREEALVCYRESLAVWQEIGSTYYVYKCLQGVAGVAGMQGQAKRAARLFGAVEHLREVSGTPIPPMNRAEYHRLVDATRAQFDQATFAAAWAEGRAMPLEQAIAEALAISG